MIRFCEQAVHVLRFGQMSGDELLSLFKEHIYDVVQFIGEDGRHIGILYHERLLKYREIGTAMIEKVFYPDDDFWPIAGAYFKEHPDDWIPVINTEQQIKGFAYWDERNEFEVENALLAFEEDDNGVFIENKYSTLRQVCIYDFNEIAYRVYQLLKKRNFPVTVIGKMWEWFSVKQFKDCNRYIDDEKYYIYAEGTASMRERIEVGRLPDEPASINFKFLVDLGFDTMNRYREDVFEHFIEQGIHAAKFTFPSYDQIVYITDLEQQAHERGVTFSVNSNNQDKKNLTYQIFGKDVCEAMVDKQDYFFETNKKYSFIGELRVYQTVEGTGKKIYVIGPCVVSGLGAKTEDCLIAQLQKLAGNGYTIVGIPIDGLRKFGLYKQLYKLPIRKKDIVIFIDEGIDLNDYPAGDTTNRYVLTDIYNDNTRPTLYSDKPIHANKTGHYQCAKYIYETYLQAKIAALIQEEDDSYLQHGEILTEEQIALVNSYIKKIEVKQYTLGGTIGSIVMNSNPFTLGHQYLIEYAAKQVDYLYVFVVEEDKSEFKFQDRIAMVRQGTKHLENITVVPSGRFIISLQTLAVYFVKEQVVDVKIDASQDLEIFGRYIAQPLHITVRFVGEEPTDLVTRQYNQQMKQILKLHSVKLVEIPRKETHNGVISASKVRAYLKSKEYNAIQEIVPRTTYEYLREMKLIQGNKEEVM